MQRETPIQGQAGQAGQTAPGGGGQLGRGMGLSLQDVETPQQRQLVDDVARAVQVCEWCADQCIQEADPNMVECIRLCEDVSELGTTVLALVPRNSRFAQSVLQAFEQAVQACGQECGRHQHSHCQECSQVLGRTAQSIQQFAGTPVQ